MADEDWQMEPDRIWRQDPRLLRIAQIMVALFALGSAGTALAAVAAPKTSDLLNFLFFAVSLAASGWLLYAILIRPVIIARHDCVYIRNAWRERVIAWGDIAKIVPQKGGLRFYRSDGSFVLAMAVQKSDLASARGEHTRADRVVEELAALAHRHSRSGEHIAPTDAERKRLGTNSRRAMITGFPTLGVVLSLRLAFGH